jgi:hypothetical protein
VALVLVALAAATFALGFRVTLGFVLLHVAGATDVVAALSRAPPLLRVGLPALGGLLVGGLATLKVRSTGNAHSCYERRSSWSASWASA